MSGTVVFLVSLAVCAFAAGCVGGDSTDSFAITAIGDSLTHGNQDGSGITYPKLLSKLTGKSVANLGIGGQRSGEIVTRTVNAYAGQAQQTFAAPFTIPTSGTVLVTFQSGYNPAFSTAKEPISTVVGGVTYSLSCDGRANVINTAICKPTTYPSSAVDVPSGNGWLSTEAGWSGETLLIWVGRNNFGSCSTLPITSTNCQVVRDIAAAVAVAQSGSSNYLVLGIVNAESEPSSSEHYRIITGINSYLASLYTQHFLDVRSDLVSKYDPSNPADIIDHANDIPPSSLRAQMYWGALADAISSTTQTSIRLSKAVATNDILTIGAERMYVTAGGSTAIVIRGYAGTATSTYRSGTAVTAVDWVHLGQNASSEFNPNSTNGLTTVAEDVYQWWSTQ